MAKFNSKSFNPQAFGAYVSRVPKTKRNELVKSKALKGNKDIRDAFSSQTTTAYAILPMYGTLDGEALNYDGKTDIDATTTTTFERGVVVVGRAKAWTEGDFSTDIAGGVNFMDNVAQQVSGYWEDIDQDTLLAILKGIFSMTGTGNLKFIDNHTFDISGLEGDKNKVGVTTLNSASSKACGDNKAKFSIAIMHSTVATGLENLKLLKYLTYTDKDGIERPLTLASWNGRMVLIDDSMPVNEVEESSEGAGDGYFTYTTYILGDGAFDYEDIGAKVPFEMSRDPRTNGGQDTLYSRQRKAFAPNGISYKKKNQKSLSPTNAELADGVNWELVNDGGVGDNRKYYSHKSISIARIISRG